MPQSQAAGRALADISSRWECDFPEDPRSKQPTQGIECGTMDRSCTTAADAITYNDLEKFSIDFTEGTVSYVETTKWYASARKAVRAQLKVEGKPDTTSTLERRTPRFFRITEVVASQARGSASPSIASILYTDEHEQVSLLSVINNGGSAVLSLPRAFAKFLFVTHYFGACYPAQ